MWFNYSLITDEHLTRDDPRFWTQSTPLYCDTVRIVGIFLCIAAFIGMILNGALVYSFIRYSVLRSSPNIHVMFIAIVGFMASCTILPSTGTSSIYCRWLYRRIGCQLSAVIAFFYGCSSSYLLCAVSLSRCYIIMRPFNANKVTVEKSVKISSIVVLVSFIWSILPVIGWNEYTLEGTRTSCCINWYDRRFSYISFTFFLFFVIYLGPLLVLIATNTITLIGFKKMRDKARHGIRTIFAAKRIEMEQRIVKSIVITTIGFAFSWTPYSVALFVSAFRGQHYAIPPLATFMCACFAKTSVIWIPLLYMSTSTQFHLRFVNHSRANHRRKSEYSLDKIARKYGLIHSNHTLSSTRADDKSSENRKHSLAPTKLQSS